MLANNVNGLGCYEGLEFALVSVPIKPRLNKDFQILMAALPTGQLPCNN